MITVVGKVSDQVCVQVGDRIDDQFWVLLIDKMDAQVMEPISGWLLGQLQDELFHQLRVKTQRVVRVQALTIMKATMEEQ